MSTNTAKAPAWINDIRAISFDLDETLWPLMPTIVDAEKAQNRWIAEHYPTLATKLTPELGKSARDAVLSQNPNAADNVTKLRKSVLAHLCTELLPERAGEIHQQLVEGAFAAFQRARNKVYPYPEAAEVLKALAQKYRIIAISNGNADVFATPLAEYFDWATSPMTAGVAKPEPEIFLQASEWLALSPSQVLHIGDNIETDVQGAMGAGMRAAWYSPDGAELARGDAEPDLVFSDLRDLLALL